MTLLTSAALGLLTWIIARYILGRDPLAWPLAAFTIALVESGASMAQNQRHDLRLQAAVLFVIAIGTLVWTAREYAGPTERFSTTNAPGD